jgi:hypothetical protein
VVFLGFVTSIDLPALVHNLSDEILHLVPFFLGQKVLIQSLVGLAFIGRLLPSNAGLEVNSNSPSWH